MSDLSKDPPIQENRAAEPAHAPAKVMLFTMLLLIATFTLTSAMLLFYAFDRTKSDTGNRAFNLASLMDKEKAAYADQFKKPAPETGQDEPGGIKERFSGSAEKVKWPKLELMGFGHSNTGAGGFAIINGKQLLPNQYLGKVKLIEVRNHDVVVECMGERKNLSVRVQD